MNQDEYGAPNPRAPSELSHFAFLIGRWNGEGVSRYEFGNDTGGIYESYGRGWLIRPDPAKDSILMMGEWNTMRVRAVGERVTTWLNGVEMIDLEDQQIGDGSGVIALQIHSGGGIKVRWRNLFLLPL